jgi:predicted MPP superfamily phosphohydrolase
MSYILTLLLEAQFSNIVLRVLNTFAAVWLGYLFIALFVLIGYDILRHLTVIDPYLAGPVIILISGSITLFGLVNTYIVRLRTIEVPAKNLKRDLRLVQISDVHLGAIHSTGFLRKLVRRANALKPDLVLITGDFADGPHRYTDESFKPLNDLKAPVYFTIGNHEYYADLEFILPLLNKTKLKILRNEMVTIDKLQLIGIDDTGNRNLITQLLAKLKPAPDKFTILMHHRPTGFAEAQRARVNLMLSGHTHAGQFFPMIMFAKLIWKFRYGLFKRHDTYLYVTSGAGTWGPPLRLGTNSEITQIQLKSI